MRWKVALTIEARGDYKMFRLQKLIRQKGFEPVFLGPLAGNELIEKLSDCDAVIAGGDPYDAQALTALHEKGRLKIIARFGVGYDKVDLKTAGRFGIAVTNTMGTMAEPVAEMAMALLLATARCIPLHDRMIRDKRWEIGPVGASLPGKTIGLVGFGSIAQKLVEYMAGFHCRFIAYDVFFNRQEAERLCVEQVTLEELARQSDYVSIHTPKTPETIGFWDKYLFEMMKPTAILINTSRGGIVNEQDLIWALQSGKIAGAGLDVFENEPLSPDSPLLQLPNIVMTPHAAGWNDQTEIVTGGRALENICDLFEGRTPRNILNAEYIV